MVTSHGSGRRPSGGTPTPLCLPSSTSCCHVTSGLAVLTGAPAPSSGTGSIGSSRRLPCLQAGIPSLWVKRWMVCCIFLFLLSPLLFFPFPFFILFILLLPLFCVVLFLYLLSPSFLLPLFIILSQIHYRCSIALQKQCAQQP